MTQIIAALAARFPPFSHSKKNPEVVPCIEEICPPSAAKCLAELRLKNLEQVENIQSHCRAARATQALDDDPPPPAPAAVPFAAHEPLYLPADTSPSTFPPPSLPKFHRFQLAEVLVSHEKERVSAVEELWTTTSAQRHAMERSTPVTDANADITLDLPIMPAAKSHVTNAAWNADRLGEQRTRIEKLKTTLNYRASTANVTVFNIDVAALYDAAESMHAIAQKNINLDARTRAKSATLALAHVTEPESRPSVSNPRPSTPTKFARNPSSLSYPSVDMDEELHEPYVADLCAILSVLNGKTVKLVRRQTRALHAAVTAKATAKFVMDAVAKDSGGSSDLLTRSQRQQPLAKAIVDCCVSQRSINRATKRAQINFEANYFACLPLNAVIEAGGGGISTALHTTADEARSAYESSERLYDDIDSKVADFAHTRGDKPDLPPANFDLPNLVTMY